MAKVNFSPGNVLDCADLDLDAEVVAGGGDFNNELIRASKKGHLEEVKALLGHKADPNHAKTSDGYTALMIASQDGHFEVVQTLLGHGADPNRAKTSWRARRPHSPHNGFTALMIASLNGHRRWSGAVPSLSMQTRTRRGRARDPTHWCLRVKMAIWRWSRRCLVTRQTRTRRGRATDPPH